MPKPTPLQVRKKGTLTLPIELRRKYRIDDGDIITLIDLEDGSFLLTPQVTYVDHSGDRVARALKESNVTEEELLAALDEERERYYQENYVQS
jgi:bifunctional DNA-binding transcriptional regulator/antitoxin component of YhaV-PrlF toxin-antitoxin module